MNASDYHGFIWDITGPEFRAHICRLTGIHELFCEFKWTELDDDQRETAERVIKNIAWIHNQSNKVDQRQNRNRAAGAV